MKTRAAGQRLPGSWPLAAAGYGKAMTWSFMDSQSDQTGSAREERKMMKNSNAMSLVGLGVAAALALSACAGGADGKASGEESKGQINLAAASGWEEGIAVTEMWKLILEEKGYAVELNYAEAGTIYQGLSDGDYDVFMDAWLPVTHADYIDRYQDSITELGSWNDDAVLTIAVNEDAPIDSLDELAENADLFNNKIIGIESGAGLTKITQEEVIPGYGLEGMDYIVSSTPAMLSELKAATDAGDNVVVTLWRPHWAYEAFPIKDLKDPQGTLGDAEGMYVYVNNAFVADQPEVTQWLTDFRMDSEQLYSLENVLFNENDDPKKYAEITRKWMDENKEYVDSLTAN